MEDDLSRTFRYAKNFYLKKLDLILIFSLPALLAFLIPLLAPAPTYLALGGVFLRTVSLSNLSHLDLIITALAYALAMFIIADTIVNINIIIRSKRTLTSITHEVVSSMGTHAMRIFYIWTISLLLLFVAQLLTYELPLRTVLYPLFALILSGSLVFVPPAVVIDNSDTPTAIRRSVRMALQNPHYILMWFGLLLLISLIEVLITFVLPSPFSGYLILLINSLFILPFLTVLQTQMYMEKYPLAR